jgi:hypothetical protein
VSIQAAAVLYHCENLITLLYISESIALLYVELVSGNTANRFVFTETKFHIQKYGGLENIEKPSPTLEVTLGSSTGTNLCQTCNHRKF